MDIVASLRSGSIFLWHLYTAAGMLRDETLLRLRGADDERCQGLRTAQGRDVADAERC